MAAILILAFTIPIATTMEVCLKYTCNSTVITEGACARQNPEGYNLTRCGYGYVCAPPLPLELETHCVKTSEYRSLFPGDHCESTAQCLYSAKCIGNICKGKSVNATCKEDGECDIELYCDGVCKKVGDSCANGERCASNKVCHKGKCILLGELRDGELADVPEACASYYISKGRCAHGLRLLNPNDYACPESEVCLYEYGNMKANSSCICGLSEKEEAFCPPGVGDIDTSIVALPLQ